MGVVAEEFGKGREGRGGGGLSTVGKDRQRQRVWRRRGYFGYIDLIGSGGRTFM